VIAFCLFFRLPRFLSQPYAQGAAEAAVFAQQVQVFRSKLDGYIFELSHCLTSGPMVIFSN